MRAWASALLLMSCTEHLSIGGVVALDAGESTVPPENAGLEAPLLSPRGLRMFDRDDVQSAFGSCGAPCQEVEVLARGDAPLVVTWADSFVGERREVCPTAGVFTPISLTRATDGSPYGTLANTLYSVPAEQCADGTPSWKVCLTALSAQRWNGACSSEPGGSWYLLDPPLQEADIELSAVFALSAPTMLELLTADALCGPVRSVARGEVDPVNNTLRANFASLDAPVHYVVLRAPGEPFQNVAPDLAGRITLCFTR